MKFIALFVALIVSGNLFAQMKRLDRSEDSNYSDVIGANFTPSTAVNQLEMWQAETFDPVTIERELAWAEQIGMNSMRVYLHHVAWQQDPPGFKKRLEKFLEIANRHRMHIILVFFDDCWQDTYQAGKQPKPVPSVHNSRWLKDPGGLIDREPLLMDTLQRYVTDVMTSFGKDKRILLWDLYNEPGHFGRGDASWPLLKNVVRWAREAKASQPLTIGVYNPKLVVFNKFQIENSDVITFHNYQDSADLRRALDTLVRFGKPVICTEYMKRTNNSTFQTCLPVLKRFGAGAVNWGLVAGKTQTNYPQGNRGGEQEPALWYHDVFRKDGTPFDSDELRAIKNFNVTDWQDGPYVFYKNDKRDVQIIENRSALIFSGDVFPVSIDDNKPEFYVKLRDRLTIEPSVFPEPEMLLAISDIEGEFTKLRDLLIANGVINKDYKWIFGKGHLVFCGDLFDRGQQVNQCLWLLYSLEEQAKARGGYVHVILGNHDLMNLSGDLRYVHPAYANTSQALGIDSKKLFGKDTELGRWLRTKNVTEKIGKRLFVHGGFSPVINAMQMPLSVMNDSCRKYYGIDPSAVPLKTRPLVKSEGPLWYRGYFLPPYSRPQSIDSTLNLYNCVQIVAGHTIRENNIALYHAGKVVGIDVDWHQRQPEGLLIHGEKLYRVSLSGKKEKIKNIRL